MLTPSPRSPATGFVRTSPPILRTLVAPSSMNSSSPFAHQSSPTTSLPPLQTRGGPDLEDWARVALRLLRWCGDRAPVYLPELEIPEVLNELARRRIDGLAYLATNKDTPQQRAYERVWRVQEQALRTLVLELNSAGVAPIVIKAGDCFPRWYDNRPISHVNDVDVVVRRSQVQMIKRTLFLQGYLQLDFDPQTRRVFEADFRKVAWAEWRGWEMHHFSLVHSFSTTEEDAFTLEWEGPVYRAADGSGLLRVSVDVHFAPPEGHPNVTFDNEHVWSRAVSIPGRPGLVLSDADALWYTLSKFYGEVALENKRSLRDFCYAIPLLTRGQIDWDVFLACCRSHHLYGETYYFLRFLDVLLGGVVPDQVLASLSSRNAPRDRGDPRDWGWQLGRLFGFDESLPLALP